MDGKTLNENKALNTAVKDFVDGLNKGLDKIENRDKPLRMIISLDIGMPKLEKLAKFDLTTVASEEKSAEKFRKCLEDAAEAVKERYPALKKALKNTEYLAQKHVESMNNTYITDQFKARLKDTSGVLKDTIDKL